MLCFGFASASLSGVQYAEFLTAAQIPERNLVEAQILLPEEAQQRPQSEMKISGISPPFSRKSLA